MHAFEYLCCQLVGRQKLLFLALFGTKGDKVLDVTSEALQHLLGVAGLEPGDGVEPIPPGDVRGLGPLIDVPHSKAQAREHLLPVGRKELQLVDAAPAAIAANGVKDVQIHILVVDRLPVDGQWASLGAARIDTGSNGVFSNRDGVKTDGSSLGGGGRLFLLRWL